MESENMRECPNCSHMDSPYWRNVRQRLYTSYCEIENLEQDEPELVALLRKKAPADVVWEKYIYHLVKYGPIVQRIHVSDSRDGKTIREPEQEKHFKFIPINQRRLLEVQEK